MHRSVTVVAPPAEYPVTRAEAKLYARIDVTDDDALIDDLIAAATADAESYTRRTFITTTLKLTLDVPSSNAFANLSEGIHDLPSSILNGPIPSSIGLSLPPVISVTSVKTTDNDGVEDTFDSAGYYVDTTSGRLILKSGYSWPSDIRTKAGFAVTYTAGYGDAAAVPKPIKLAILMHVARMYEERLVCQMPASCEQLLNKYRIYGEGLR